MSYRIGISIGGRFINVPYILCDKCGAIAHVSTLRGKPYKWFLDHKPPPKWQRIEGIFRIDYCPACKGTKE